VSAAEKLDFVVARRDDTGPDEPDKINRLDELVRSHRGRVFGLCYRYAGNRADAEDLVQETFLRAYRGLPGFRGDANLSTWVYRIAVNVCLNWVSTQKPRTEELSEELVDPSPSPAQQLGTNQTSAVVREAIGRLPERQRITLLLRVYQELSHKEISEVMDCPVGTAKANFFFALKNLRKQFESDSGKLAGGAQ
jgi:RNA polymerase sigma-70 factor (ECF subfamily)